MTRVLISGVSGFTGVHLARYLKTMGLEIHGLDTVLPKTVDHGRVENLDLFYSGDVRDKKFIQEIIRTVRPDYLFHLAGLIGSDNFEELLDVNVQGTKNILDAVQGLTTRVLSPGSAAEYGVVAVEKQPVNEEMTLRPVSFYGISKVCQTLICRRYHFIHDCQVYIARSFNIIGPGAPARLVCSSLARQVAAINKKEQDPVIRIKNQDSIRDFVDIRDVVKAYWAIVSTGTVGEIYNVCCSKGTPIRDIVDAFRNMVNMKVDVKLDQGGTGKTAVPMSVGDNRKITTATSWRPEISLANSLGSMVDFYMSMS
ncbi:MAG TPA: GDP-mannose 4,6-dehydratase [bacterium]